MKDYPSHFKDKGDVYLAIIYACDLLTFNLYCLSALGICGSFLSITIQYIHCLSDAKADQFMHCCNLQDIS